MNKFSLKALCSLMLAFTLALGMGYGSMSKAFAAKSSDKAIVVVSFGTTFDDSRKACIGSVENRIQQEFPEYDVYRAFTSKIVMKRLADRNIMVNDLEKTLVNLKKQGYKEVVVQTTHLTPGEEYEKKVLATVSKFNNDFDKLVVGRPVLVFDGKDGKPNDFEILADALQTQMPSLQMNGRSVVFMGHGSPHQHNPAYQKLQNVFNARGSHCVIGVVEETDHPNFEDAKVLLNSRNVKEVILMPLMLVAGDHANNDMAGAEKDSWKSLLEQEGMKVTTYIHGLGENTAVQDIYVQHVRDAILGLN